MTNNTVHWIVKYIDRIRCHITNFTADESTLTAILLFVDVPYAMKCTVKCNAYICQ